MYSTYVVLLQFTVCPVQAKAPDSSVIVVGTHLDLVSRYEREDKIRVWIEMINAYKKYRVHSHLYPNILGVCFVGIPKSGKHIGVHGPNGLADCIYNVAMKMEVPNGVYMYIIVLCVCVCASMKILLLRELFSPSELPYLHS